MRTSREGEADARPGQRGPSGDFAEQLSLLCATLILSIMVHSSDNFLTARKQEALVAVKV